MIKTHAMHACQARSQGGFGGFDRTTLFSVNRIKTYCKFIHTPPTLISRERGQDGRQSEGRDLYNIMMLKSAVPVLPVFQEPVNFTAASYGPSSFAVKESASNGKCSRKTTTRALPDYY